MLWSTLIFGGIGTPLVTQQLTWWFKVHLSQKAHVSRAMLISKLECWWTKFNVELSLIKLKSKVLTIALRTTKLNCKVECWSLSSQMLHTQVECCDLFWFLAGMELHICHHREVTDTIEHALIDCSIIDAFWTKVQHLIDKIADSNLPLTVGLKVFAKVPQTSDLFRKKHTDLVNWIIAIRRSGIHKSAVWHRVHDQTLPPAAIFGSIVKSHLRYQFKLICK